MAWLLRRLRKRISLQETVSQISQITLPNRFHRIINRLTYRLADMHPIVRRSNATRNILARRSAMLH